MKIYIDNGFYFLKNKKEIFSINDNFIKEFENLLINFINFLGENPSYDKIKNNLILFYDNFDLLFDNLYNIEKKIDNLNNSYQNETFKIFKISEPIQDIELTKLKVKLKELISDEKFKIVDNDDLDFLELSQSKFILEEVILDEVEKLKNLKEIYTNYMKIIEKDLKVISFFEKLFLEIKSFDEKILDSKKKKEFYENNKKELENLLEKKLRQLKDLEKKKHDLEVDLTKKEPLNIKNITKLDEKLLNLSNKIEKLEIKIENYKSEIEIYKNRIDLIKKKIHLNQKKCYNWLELLLTLGLIHFTNFGDCKKKGRKYLLKIADIEEKILKLKQKINNYKSEEKLLKSKIKIFKDKLKQKEQEIDLRIKSDLVQINLIKKEKKVLDNEVLNIEKNLKKIKFNLLREEENLKDLNFKKENISNLNFESLNKKFENYFKLIQDNIDRNKKFLDLLKEQSIEVENKSLLVEFDGVFSNK